ncbi:MAG: insulinase family protein [Eubacteriaceae bacterium]|nr:insulinase family protein [Eubacteriaceae bacterium]
MNKNDIIHGFKIVNVRDSQEAGGTLIEMEHLKTGAKLIWFRNPDENKLFSATFKTLPHDSTGVFHILEHSVLEGSANFPVKEPFLDLLKSSMSTFLNAMTWPDKTMYPVSSKNEQDFMNLTKVYLDAVFRPAIYTNPNIFRQEGWHYELPGEEGGEPIYNGVVYNEMKGAMSSVDDLQYEYTSEELFPDNCYGYNSGGDPKVIPQLTYENFLAAHREFYSPSNALLYLDGDVPIDRVLKLIDEEYLSTFERNPIPHEIAFQQPLGGREVERDYAIGSDEDTAGKTYFVIGDIFATWEERKKTTGLSLIASYLAGDNESPLKRAILEKGLAKDLAFVVNDGVAQPFYAVEFQNTDPEKRGEIVSTYEAVLKDIVDNGIDRDIMTGCLNRFEFSLRELPEPQGLTRNIMALYSWLYGGDPMLYLENEALLKELRADLDTGYFENLAGELMDTSKVLKLTLNPSVTRAAEDAADEAARVKAAVDAMTEDEDRTAKDNFEIMRRWQEEPDSEEAAATLPVLKLSDVNPEPERVPTEIHMGDGDVEILFHSVPTNGVVYGNLYFSLADASVEELQTLSAMTEFLGMLPTEHYSSKDLQKEIHKIFGTFDSDVVMTGFRDCCDKVRPYFLVTFGVLKENLEKAAELLREILLTSDWSARSVILENLLQARETFSQNIQNSGNRFAARRALSHSTAGAMLEEKILGYDFWRYLKDMTDGFEDKSDKLVADCAELAARTFASGRLTVGVTSTEYPEFCDSLGGLFPEGTQAPDVMVITPDHEKFNDIILIPSGISYASLAGNMLAEGFNYHGVHQTLSQILSFGYLWSEIRVKGGAYGCGFNCGLTGSMSFTSFRDPNPLNSLEVYAKAGDFMRDFCQSDETVDKYIISSVSNMDGLKSSSAKGRLADMLYLRGSGFDEIRELRCEMLRVTKEEYVQIADFFDQLAEKGSKVIIGNAETLSEKLEDPEWTVYSLS